MLMPKSFLPAVLLATGLIALAAAAPPASAQGFPGRPVHLVVAYAPGGSGAIGTQSVVAAVPDGHTLLVGQTAEVAINQHWIKGLSYDPEKDLQPVALAAIVPLALSFRPPRLTRRCPTC